MPDAVPVPQRPQLRCDLQFSPARERGEDCCYVRDPGNRNFYRLGDTARRAVERMDGQRDLDAIAAELGAELGVDLPRAALETLVQQLSRLGFLTNGAPPTARRRIRGGPLYLLIPLVDPDRWLARLGPLWRVLVSRPVALLLAALIGLGVVLTVWQPLAGWPIGVAVQDWRDLAAVYLIVSLALVAHELAHAVTLKRFGGEVHEMGVLLLYLQPCFFCNVSDGYLLDRRRRLWVSLAGLYLELALWGVAVTVAVAAGSGSDVGRVAALVGSVIGLKALLFNLNPLIKLDGYYLLVDLVQIPNLRQRAFAYLGDRLRRLAGRPARVRPRDRREAAWLLGYAVLASAFLALLFATLADRTLAAWRHGEWTVTALLVSVACAALLLRGLRGLSGLLRPGVSGAGVGMLG